MIYHELLLLMEWMAYIYADWRITSQFVPVSACPHQNAAKRINVCALSYDLESSTVVAAKKSYQTLNRATENYRVGAYIHELWVLPRQPYGEISNNKKPLSPSAGWRCRHGLDCYSHESVPTAYEVLTQCAASVVREGDLSSSRCHCFDGLFIRWVFSFRRQRNS